MVNEGDKLFFNEPIVLQLMTNGLWEWILLGWTNLTTYEGDDATLTFS